MFKYYNQKRRDQHIAHEIYGSIVAQARSPYFYTGCEVPDTVEGRFEMLVLHMTLIINRLKNTEKNGQEIGRLISEAFIDDLDDSFREMGIGDLAVPKRMKTASEAYFGRLHAYGDALDHENLEELEQAIDRNFSQSANPASVNARTLAQYMMRTAKMLKEVNIEDLTAGRLSFSPLPDNE